MRNLVNWVFRTRHRAGRFYCHIGPPKTASTALQTELQDLRTSDPCYIGTFQPRERNDPHGLYSLLIRSMASDPDACFIADLQRKIDQKINGGSDLLMSEEMVLVNQKDAAFEQKIRRLHRVIGQYRPALILTLREPTSALKSLYSEIYFRQAISPRKSFSEFLRSAQARVFDYPHLVKTLNMCGFDDVRLTTIPPRGKGFSLGDLTGNCRHGSALNLKGVKRTEATARRQIDELTIPENLETHLLEGYAKMLADLSTKGSNREND